MGLDMYLSAKHYVKHWDHAPADEQVVVTVTKGGVPVPLGNVTYVIEEVGYWRKANAIHQWFVTHVQGGKDECEEYDVAEEQLDELRLTCLAVLANPSTALALLPPQGGFFFGSTEVDEGYFDDLRDTVAIIDAIKAKPDNWHGDVVYRSSW